jgi:S-(hydroxymethyl)glutathione dehydrogenase/alcohol dehydrogenase
VTGVTVGDHVVFCMVASCGRCSACRAGRRTLCEPVGICSLAGTLLDGSSRLRAADGTMLQHALTVACFAEYAVLPAGGVIALPTDVALWQAALLGCGVVTGFGAVSHAAAVAIGERVCVVGCGGVGLQVIAAARIAGAATIIAVDRGAAKLERARARGATHTIDAGELGTDGAAREIRALTGGGVDHAFEAIGLKATAEQAFNMLAKGGTATIIGMIPLGQTVELSGFQFLLEKKLQGSNMGSNRFRVDMPQYVDWYLAGRLKLDELVSAVIPLARINDGFAALKTGEVARQLISFE